MRQNLIKTKIMHLTKLKTKNVFPKKIKHPQIPKSPQIQVQTMYTHKHPQIHKIPQNPGSDNYPKTTQLLPKLGKI
jgi:hypothetical protein